MRILAALACAGLLLAQRKPIEDAWDLAIKGQRPQAIRLLNHMIKDNPRDADARLLLGSLLQEEGERTESIAQLTEAVRLRPRSAEAQNALGEALNAFGDVKAARAPFEKAVSLDPRFAQAHVNLGMILLEAGESDAAAKHLDRAIGLLGHKPDAAYAHYLRAKVCTEQNDVPKAAAQLQEAVTLRPDLAEAWSDLGDARKTLSDDAGALTAFERAVSLAPDDAVAQTRLGAEYLNQGKAHLAAAHLQEAARLDPTNQSTLYSLQRAFREDGQEEQADAIKKKLAEMLREKDKADQNLLAGIQLNNQGADLERAGNLPAALEKYRAAVALLPDHVGIRVNFAVALLRLAEWQQGLAEMREAVRREPGNALWKAALDDALKQAPAEFGGQGQAGKSRKAGTKY
ncbi:MAG: tetratricopeptide repeat protein [Acidobacteriia bacterium]|nr:tetratricopeptide repeat protein [Terriglobia bacterium]